MIDDLKKLISFRSVTHDAAACTALLKYEQDLFVGYGMKTELGSIAGFPYLLATTGDDLRGVDVLLQAHIDVVPGTDALFAPSTDGDKLIGRGTYDMLFAVACFNKLLAGFADENTLTQKNIGVMLTSDEEIGGENGVAQLISGYECKVCILPDAGTHEQICTEAKLVCRRPWLSKGLMRTKRCVPRSPVINPYA